MTPTDKGVVLFDGVCNFCNDSVNFIIDRDPNDNFRFASLQSKTGQELLAKLNLPTENFDSVVLVQNGKLYQKSDAALRIANELKGAWSIFGKMRWVPRFIRDGVYNFIANNRYRFFGKKEDACVLPTPERRERFLEIG